MLEEDVLRFLRTAIASLWTLELLLLIAREAAREWSVEGLTRELRASVAITTGALRQLGEAGLVVGRDGLYRYSPANAELERLVRRTVEAYATFPLAVTEAVLSAPSSNIQLFADAFRLKKE